MTKTATTASPVSVDAPAHVTDDGVDAEVMRRLEAFLLIVRFAHR